MKFLDDQFVSQYKDLAPPWGPLGYVTYKRTYARPLPDGGTEEWWQTVARVVEGNYQLEYKHKLATKGSVTNSRVAAMKYEAMQMYHYIFNMYFLPAGRGLWLSGTEASERHGAGLTNCFYISMKPYYNDPAYAFKFIMNQLMLGSGVGFGIQKKYIDRLPSVRSQIELCFDGEKAKKCGNDFKHFVVEDSREGWVQVVHHIITSHFSYKGGLLPIWVDLSNIRPKGTPLKTFGGVAPGPEPLKELLEWVTKIFNGAQGRKLTSVEVLDIVTCIGRCVVSGNVRRSALIALGDPNDIDFLDAKNVNFNPVTEEEKQKYEYLMHHRWASNNSIVIEEDSCIFWPDLANAIINNGEPGIVNLYNCRNSGRLIDGFNPAADPAAVGTNPCVAGGTKILTYNGVKTFEELAKTEKDVLVWCIDLKTNQPKLSIMKRPHKTRSNVSVLEVTFDSGLKVKCTEDHNFFTLQRNKIKAKNLKIGQSVSAFSIHRHRDGHLRVVRNVKDGDYVQQYFLHRIVADYFGLNIDNKIVHHLNGDPTDNRIENLGLLTQSEHNKEHYAAQVLNGFFYKTPGGIAKKILENHKVVSVIPCGTEDVYNGMVEEFHNYIIVDDISVGKSYLSGVISANCGEITLEDGEPCNLVEVFPSKIPQNVGYLDVVTLAYKYAKRVTLANYEDPVTAKVVRKNRRIGVSISGWVDWICKKNLTENSLSNILSVLYERIREVDKVFSAYLNVNRSIKLTTVKPSGTISLLAGVSPGIHAPYSAYYLRRIQMDATSPLVKLLTAAGYSGRPAVQTPNAYLFEFPIKSEFAKNRRFKSAQTQTLKEQLDFQLFVQQYWADNQVSATINFKKSETKQLETLLYRYSNILKSTSFLPLFELDENDDTIADKYPDLPYIPITKEKYEELIKPLKVIPQDIFKLFTGDVITLEDECSGGSCPIK
jgi:ribonucleotide reductase alpha subunit